MQKELVPVFAVFGACVQVAQNLESAMTFLLYLANEYEKANFDKRSKESLSTDDAPKTMGSLFKVLRAKEHFTKPEKEIIFKAIEARNYLIHDYMVKNGRKAFTEDGRDWLIEDILRIRAQLEKAQQYLEEFLNKYLSQHGTSVEEAVKTVDRELKFDFEETSGKVFH